MTDPNPLREDEAVAIGFATYEALDEGYPAITDLSELDELSQEHYLRMAYAAITALDQVRENRAASPQQQAYEAQSALGIAPLPGYPVDQVRSKG